MKFFYLVLISLTLIFSVFAEEKGNSNNQRLIFLTEGVVGGINAPIVRQQIIFYQDTKGENKVWVRKLKEAPFKYTYYFAKYDLSQFEALLGKLSVLKGLPLENPVAGDDIYQLDTELGVFSNQWQWMNQAPGGCIRMKSEVAPSKRQKEKFQETVQLVKTELTSLNLEETTKESFETVSQKAWDIIRKYRQN